EDDATITTRAYVVTGVELTPDLMHFLLRENDRMRFGAFGVDQDNDIFFEHTIVGSTCDMEELKSSVLAVVYTADQYDDQIIQKWGGQRAVDRRSS
ncbi:MAG TPA: YbjN domain-containing protein, partial [Anaerolineaceae bacterium]|nr:YbjN domain-containing protein [Anaerolineaceae bacterium]